jgi:hypothetical protein
LAHRLPAAFALAVALLFLAVSYAPAAAQTPPRITDGGVENRFPQSIVFRMSAKSDSPIERVRLRYKILPDGASAIGQPAFQPGTSVSASFELEGNSPPDIYLPPGTRIEYRWQVTDAAGDEAETQPQAFFYDDVRFHWKPLSERGVTIYYYSGSDKDAADMLTVAGDTITSMSALLGAKINFPVNVWAYDSVEDMRPALMKQSETYEQSILTAGVRVSTDTVLVLGNVSFDTLRHELTHVVTGVAGESALGASPAWLDEGTAVYAQSDAGDFGSAIQKAIERGRVLSVRSITSPPGDPAKVDLFYGEAWSLVSYLVDKYGGEKFAPLFAEIKSGKRIDSALQAVYGFDQDGLEDEWRASNGLPARATPAPQQGEPQVTAAPSGQERQDADGGGISAGEVAAIALGALGLAAVGGLLVRTLARRYR